MTSDEPAVVVELGDEAIIRAKGIFIAGAFRLGRIMAKGLEKTITIEVRGRRDGLPANVFLVFAEDLLARLLVEVMSAVRAEGPDAVDRWSDAVAHWVARDIVHDVFGKKTRPSTSDGNKGD